jgi:hypothetical protein
MVTRGNEGRAFGGLSLVRGDVAPVVVHGAAEPGLSEDVEGVVASELVGAVAGSLLDALASCRHRLDAELALASVFGTLASGLPEELDESERVAAYSLLLSELILHCRELVTTDSLGFLRLAAEQGPVSSRELAAAAADRIEGGVRVPRWAAGGTLTVLRAWRYRDVFGAQTSIGILFSYGHREHALCMLIDHELGGGIKDAWFAEGRHARGLRDRVAATMATEPMALFEDLTEGEALDVMREALRCAPCPEAPDQVENVDAYVYLVHARAQRLAQLLGAPPVELYADTITDDDHGVAGRGPISAEVLRLKVTLEGSKPPIWRRLEVPDDVHLAVLHGILQTAFGWTNAHLHAFEIEDHDEVRILEGARLRRTKISELLGKPGDRLTYVYDFGDDWRHQIVLEERLPADSGARYPRCTAGRRAGPLEDSGGVPGYDRLLEILADPDHPEYAELAEWAGPVDPARFDRAAINCALTPQRPSTGT